MSDGQVKVGYTGDVVKDWWALLWFAAFLLIFGFVAYMSDMTLTDFTLFFAGLLLFSGIIFICSAIKGSMLVKSMFQHMVEGLIYFFFGLVILFVAPNEEDMVLYFAIFAVVAGAMRVIEGFMMPADVKSGIGRKAPIILLVAGFLSLIVGVYVLIFPMDSVLDVSWAIGGYTVLFGMLLGTAALGAK